jgi:hypothetical protein
LHSDEEEEMAVCERSRMQQPDFYRDEVFKLVARRDECAGMPEGYVEKC